MPISIDDAANRTLVVVIPCLNEEAHIGRILSRFVAEPDNLVRKIVIADGGSTDGTLSIVQQYVGRDTRVALIRNQQRIQSSGVNRAVEQYGDLAPFVLRIDAHADYPAGFCRTLLTAQSSTAANSVVVSMIAKGSGCFQIAAAAAQNSLLGNGGAAHRKVAEGRFVDHGHHALMEVAAFRAVGGYDEAFSHNEDAEFDYRLNAAGYRVYLCGGTDITYYPRATPLALLRQYFHFGRGRAMNILKHRARPRLRQLMPVMTGPAVVTAMLWPIWWVMAVPALLWATLCVGYGIALGLGTRRPCAYAAGFAAMLMHLGFSLGFISQLLTARPATKRLIDHTSLQR
jgi:succinoglycan biosynthesis protein ExoA